MKISLSEILCIYTEFNNDAKSLLRENPKKAFSYRIFVRISGGYPS